MVEDVLAVRAISLESVLADEVLYNIFARGESFTPDDIEVTGKRASTALKEAFFTPGAVISVECNKFSEANLVSAVIEELGPKLHPKAMLIKEKSSTTKFEFTNNSVIYVIHVGIRRNSFEFKVKDKK